MQPVLTKLLIWHIVTIVGDCMNTRNRLIGRLIHDRMIQKGQIMNKSKRRRLQKSKTHKRLVNLWLNGLPDPS
jgi:hypothetical protein